VEINDIGLFRAEIDVEAEYLNTDFYLEFELYFSDLSSMGGPDKWQQQTAVDFESKAVFKLVSTQKFLLRRLPQGMSEFVSIVFEDQYFSALNCVVEATLLDFRFRMKSFKSVQAELASFQERGITVKNERGEEIRPSLMGAPKQSQATKARPSMMNPDGGIGPG
jgi:hypothetical protein